MSEQVDHQDRGNFEQEFEALTGHKPYEWQYELYRLFLAADLPLQCCIPTGMGKTAVMQIWLLALAWEARYREAQRRIPLRLFWVVDRRVVVDQATSEAESIVRRVESAPSLVAVRDSLRRLSVTGSKAGTVAVSTLRGECADNRAWSRDPSRPAIVVGTVDMIGSRLLFSGYGDSRRRRPHHAGLMAQDSLIVNDESHLTPAFARLLQQVAALNDGGSGMRVMLLSATPKEESKAALRISARDETENPVFRARYQSVKQLHLIETGDLAATIRKLACKPHRRTVVFVRSPEEARRLAAAVNKANPAAPVFLLTGLQRGKERDELLLRPGMQAFLRKGAGSISEPCWLVATSAGEVGVDLSCDRLITDLDSAEHILQRLGRLNRFGETEGHAYVVYNPSKAVSKRSQPCLQATIAYLKGLPDVSPASLVRHPPPPEALAPAPRVSPLDPWLVDAWSATSISNEDWPDRPPVEFWLRGDDEEGSPPETQVAWREDVRDLCKASQRDLEEVFECFPVLAHERLRQYTPSLCRDLEQSNLHREPAIVITSDGDVRALTVGGVLKNPSLIRYGTLLLSPGVGFLDENGMVDWSRAGDERSRYDISATPGRMRLRLMPGDTPPATSMLLRHEVALFEEDQDEPYVRWRYYTAASNGAYEFQGDVALSDHLEQTARVARELAERICLDEKTSHVLQWAARWHDAGKARDVWQMAAANPDPSRPLAKSRRVNSHILDGFRHEFGSLLDAAAAMPPDFTMEQRDLALHLIATHHGWGRPCFTPRMFDRTKLRRSAQAALEAAQRFGRLQQCLGPWRLAYLEALLRCADALASEGSMELPVDA